MPLGSISTADIGGLQPEGDGEVGVAKGEGELCRSIDVEAVYGDLSRIGNGGGLQVAGLREDGRKEEAGEQELVDKREVATDWELHHSQHMVFKRCLRARKFLAAVRDRRGTCPRLASLGEFLGE